MILTRTGNKTKLANHLLPYFPKHEIYIEPFFGAGGIYFNKPKVKYNILNDLNEDVYNLFRVVIDKKEELVNVLETIPVIQKQFNEWVHGKEEETDVMKAFRFLVLSNFSLYGAMNTLRIGNNNEKEFILSKIDETQRLLADCKFTNLDFRKVIKSVAFRHEKDRYERTFIYADPPYINTSSTYELDFTEQDHTELLDALIDSRCKFAISEFETPFVVQQAKERGLYVNTLLERRNIKNRQVEILVTNYPINNQTLF